LDQQATTQKKLYQLPRVAKRQTQKISHIANLQDIVMLFNICNELLKMEEAVISHYQIV
jgi:hypothetical protein